MSSVPVQNQILERTSLYQSNNTLVIGEITHPLNLISTITIKFFDALNNFIVARSFPIQASALNPFVFQFTVSQATLTLSLSIGPQNSLSVFSSTFDATDFPIIDNFSIFGTDETAALIDTNTLAEGAASTSASLAPVPNGDPFAFGLSLTAVVIFAVVVAVLFWLLAVNVKKFKDNTLTPEQRALEAEDGITTKN